MWSNSQWLVFRLQTPSYLQIKWYAAAGHSAGYTHSNVKLFCGFCCTNMFNFHTEILYEYYICAEPVLYGSKVFFSHFHTRYSCCLDKKYDYLNMFYWNRWYLLFFKHCQIIIIKSFDPQFFFLFEKKTVQFFLSSQNHSFQPDHLK